MTEAHLPDRDSDQPREGKKSARITHIRGRGFTPKPPEVVAYGPLQPAKIDGIIPTSTDEVEDGVNTGFVPKAPEPILTHKGGMSRGATIGSLAAAGVLAAAGGAAIAYESGVFDSGSNSEAKVQIIPAPEQPANIPGTEIPNPLKTPESTPTVAATPTPEKPKFVYWTKEEVQKAQQDALSQGRVLLLDTWTEGGGRLVSATGGYGDPMVGINGLSPNQDIQSPFFGKVTSVYGIGKGPAAKGIDVQIDSDHVLKFYMHPTSQELVAQGFAVAVQSPIIHLNTDSTVIKPSTESYTAEVYVQLVDAKSNKGIGITTDDVLRDSSGNIVHLQPSSASGK